MAISTIEIGVLVNFFNKCGYVLDFSTTDFDTFTYESVGVPLCEKFRLSKGKSLVAFINQTSTDVAYKLLSDLMSHYELSSEYERDENDDIQRHKQYLKCKAIIEKYRIDYSPNIIANDLKNIFDSDYMNSQIELMTKLINDNPTESIGKAKELIESCCKTILEKLDKPIDKNWDLTKLTDEVFKLFNLMPKNIDNDVKGAEAIRKVLGNMKGIAHGMAELRNLYGSGHGKPNSYKGLEPRHARMAVGASVTLTQFLWDSYERNCMINSN